MFCPSRVKRNIINSYFQIREKLVRSLLHQTAKSLPLQSPVPRTRMGWSTDRGVRRQVLGRSWHLCMHLCIYGSMHLWIYARLLVTVGCAMRTRTVGQLGDVTGTPITQSQATCQ